MCTVTKNKQLTENSFIECFERVKDKQNKFLDLFYCPQKIQEKLPSIGLFKATTTIDPKKLEEEKDDYEYNPPGSIYYNAMKEKFPYQQKLHMLDYWEKNVIPAIMKHCIAYWIDLHEEWRIEMSFA